MVTVKYYDLTKKDSDGNPVYLFTNHFSLVYWVDWFNAMQLYCESNKRNTEIVENRENGGCTISTGTRLYICTAEE